MIDAHAVERPDIVLLAAEWPLRALLRAQLIEEGFAVAAVDAWADVLPYMRAAAKPSLVVVDLKDLPDPSRVVDDLRTLIHADRVLVITAIGTPTAGQLRSAGFRVVARPASIDAVVAAVAKAVRGP